MWSISEQWPVFGWEQHNRCHRIIYLCHHLFSFFFLRTCKRYLRDVVLNCRSNNVRAHCTRCSSMHMLGRASTTEANGITALL